LGWLCLSASAAVIVAVSSFNGWHGGYSTGPRYLIIIIPLLVFLLPPFSSLGRPLAIFYCVTGVLSIFNIWVIATTSVLAGTANPLYGEMYARFWSGKVSVQAIEMFLG
jgi:hypothetical protein